MENPLVWLLCALAAFLLLKPLFKKPDSPKTSIGETKHYTLKVKSETKRNEVLSQLRDRTDYITTVFALPDFDNPGGYVIDVNETRIA